MGLKRGCFSTSFHHHVAQLVGLQDARTQQLADHLSVLLLVLEGKRVLVDSKSIQMSFFPVSRLKTNRTVISAIS